MNMGNGNGYEKALLLLNEGEFDEEFEEKLEGFLDEDFESVSDKVGIGIFCDLSVRRLYSPEVYSSVEETLYVFDRNKKEVSTKNVIVRDGTIESVFISSKDNKYGTEMLYSADTGRFRVVHKNESGVVHEDEQSIIRLLEGKPKNEYENELIEFLNSGCVSYVFRITFGSGTVDKEFIENCSKLRGKVLMKLVNTL